MQNVFAVGIKASVKTFILFLHPCVCCRIQMTLILLWLPQSKLSDNAPPFHKLSSHSLH